MCVCVCVCVCVCGVTFDASVMFIANGFVLLNFK